VGYLADAIWHYYDTQPNENERRLLYAKTLGQVDNAVSRGELAEAKSLLASLVPPPGKEELRGFEWYYFERVCRQSEKKWYGHAGGSSALAIAPDGQIAATVGPNREIFVWDVATSQRRHTLRGHTNTVNTLTTIDALAFMPNSKTLASAQRGGEVMLWNAQVGETLGKLPPITGPLHAMALTADGTKLAFFSQGNRISVWDLPAGKEVFSCKVVGNVYGGIMAVSPSGKTVAVQEDTGIELLDVTTGKVVQIVKNNMVTVPPPAMAFSPDERTFAAVASDGSVQCWDVKTGKEVAAFHGTKEPVYCVAFAPGGRTLATGGMDRLVRLWNLDHQTEKRSIRGAAADIGLIAFTPDGKALLVSGGEFVRWYPLVEPEILKGLDQEVWSVAFSPDSKMLATGTDDGPSKNPVKLWDAATGKELFGLPGHDALVTAVAFAPDGKTLATASYDFTVKLWDLTTRKVRATFGGNTKPVRAVAWSPDGKLVAAVADDFTLRLWDAATGAALKPFAWPGKRRVRAVAYSPDGQTIVAGCEDGRLLFLHAKTLKEQRSLRDESEIWCLAFSPDGKTLAMGNRLGQIRLLDGSTGASLRSCRGHTMGVKAVSFSPDGRTLASGSTDKMVKLWQVATGLELATLPEHGHHVNTVAFAPDGKTLASGSHDGVVKLWKTGPTGEAAPR
jgi:WD40 repeat protein